MLFGSISPAKKTAIVVRTVLSVTAWRPHLFETVRVTTAAAERCTMFVPIKIVVIALSKRSRISSAICAFLLPDSAIAFSFGLEAEAKDVSVNARYAAHSTRQTASNQGNRLPSSIFGLSTPFLTIIKFEFYHNFYLPSTKTSA